jgi:nucleoside-diphosphate-sugar epimerase
MPTLLITGADGFIGQQLCALALQRGYAVRGAVRRLNAAGLPQHWSEAPAQVEWLGCGEVGPETDWSAAVAGVDAIVHLAGRAHILRETAADPEAAARAVNVGGAQSLAESALRADAPRIVFLSSIHVHGDRSTVVAVDETAPIRPHNAYARSKWDAEQVLAALRGQGLRDTVIRPCLVHGPGAKGNLRRLMGALARGWPLPLGAVRNARSLVGVMNLCDLILHCVNEPRTIHETFVAADEPPLSTPALVQALADGMGRRAHLLRVPPALMGAALGVAGMSHAWCQLSGSLVVNAAKSRAFCPRSDPVPLHTGLAEMARAYLAERSHR